MEKFCGQIKPGTYSTAFAVPACQLPIDHDGLHLTEISYVRDPMMTVWEWDDTITMQFNRFKPAAQ